MNMVIKQMKIAVPLFITLHSILQCTVVVGFAQLSNQMEVRSFTSTRNRRSRNHGDVGKRSSTSSSSSSALFSSTSEDSCPLLEVPKTCTLDCK